MSELITIFPMRGAVVYRGFSFSITLRQASIGVNQELGAPMNVMAEMSDAFLMMDQLIDAHQAGQIDLSAFAVQDPNDQRDPREAAQHQTQPSVPQGNFGKNVMNIVRLRKSMNRAGDKAIIHLFDSYSAEKPAVYLTDGKQIAKVLSAINTAMPALALDQFVPCNLYVEFKLSDDGKYNNFVGLVVPSSASNNVPF